MLQTFDAPDKVRQKWVSERTVLAGGGLIVEASQQVLPDEKCKPDDEHTLSEKTTSWRQNVEEMLLRHGSLEPTPSAPLSANVWVIKAMDHALQVGCGFGLARFLPSRAMQPLDPAKHRRFQVKPGPTNPAQLFTNGRSFRWAVEDLHTKKTWLEVSSEAPATLHVCSDQGTVGWQSSYWLVQASGVCATWRADIHHRIHNDTKLAVKEASLVLPQTAATALVNLGVGPWCNNSYQNQIRDGATEYFSVSSPADELFKLHYDLIAADLDIKGTLGTQEHMEATYTAMKESFSVWQQGNSVKSSRWFGFYDKAEPFLQSWHTLLLVLTAMGVKRGWMKGTQDLPLMRSCSFTEVLMGRCDVAEEDEQHDHEAASSSKRPSDAFKLLSGLCGVTKSGNRLHLAALLLGNKHLRNLVALLVHLVQPLRIFHGQLVKQLHSPEGTRVHAVWEVALGWEALLGQIWDQLSSETALAQMGFRLHKVDERDEELADEQNMAETAVRLCIALVSRRLLSHLHFSFSLPDRLAGLLAKDEALVRKTLQVAKKWFEMLIELEAAMGEYKYLADIHHELQWPRSQFVRWALMSLSEVRFERVPASVATALEHAFTSYHHTQAVEDVFHLLREDEARSPNHSLSRQRRWQVCVESDLLEKGGRQQLQPVQTERSGRRQLPASLFDSEAKVTPTLSAGCLSSLTYGTWWSSPGPNNLAMLPTLLMALAKCWPEWQPMQDYWHSLLCVPGSLIKEVKSTKGGMVLTATPYGVLLWKLVRHGAGQTARWTPAKFEKGKQPWMFVSIEDTTSWDAMALKAEPPAAVLGHLQPGEPSSAHIHFSKVGTVHSILHFSALRCFPNLSVQHLKKLLQSPRFGVGKPPKLEKECIEALLTKLFPRASQRAEIEAIMKLREQPKSAVVVEGMEGSELDMNVMQGVLDQDDLDLLRSELQMHANSTAPSAPPLPARADRKPAPPLPEGEDFCLEDLHALLPRKPGCKLWVESKWHHRYRGRYPKDPPNSVSKCWGESVSKRRAALFVIQWLWSQHTQTVGEQCPWDLEASD